MSVIDFLAASVRWQRHNARQRAGGCRCGRPATMVRRLPGAVGLFSPEVYTCDEHVNVNAWAKVGDHWAPSSQNRHLDFDSPGMREWSGTVTHL